MPLDVSVHSILNEQSSKVKNISIPNLLDKIIKVYFCKWKITIKWQTNYVLT